MGTYAETDFTIECDSHKTAKKVKKTIESLKDNLGNFDFESPLECGEDWVFGRHSSRRIQNLEYQCEEIWKAIKDIKGVKEAHFPFMIEDEGCWFSNE